MIVKSKQLAVAGWKDLAARSKVKDNGLLKALEKLARVGDEAYDEQARAIGDVVKLAAALRKDKAVAAQAAVVRYLGEIEDDAQGLQRDVARARAEHEKTQRKAATREGDEDDDDTDVAELLTSKLKPLLKLVAKGETMHTLLARSGKQVVVLMSRKPIPPARRKMLADRLGGGGVKFYAGTCGLEGGATTFRLQAEVAGLSKLVRVALLEQTGVRLNRIACRGDDGDDHDADADATGGAAAVPAAVSSGIEAGASLAQMPAGEPLVEDLAAEIVDLQAKILDSWKSALRIFHTTMSSAADAETTPGYRAMVFGLLAEKVVGAVVERAPFLSAAADVGKALEEGCSRAAAAGESATLRDFVNLQERAADHMGRALAGRRQSFIVAVRGQREAAGIDDAVGGAARKGGGKPRYEAVASNAQVDAWAQTLLLLTDMRDAVQRAFAAASPESLVRSLSEAWIARGSTYAGMGVRVPAAVLIRLNPDHSMRDAHIEGSGGQKLAEELLKEFPEGVDVFGFKTRRRILLLADNGLPQASLVLDANNRDLSTGAMAEGNAGALYRYVMSRGLPPTKKLTGD